MRSGRSKNCGCTKMKKMANANTINEIGKIYGKLTVVEKAETPKGKIGAYWKCKCKCGNEVIVKGDYLRNGDTQSCGCLNSKNEAQIAIMLKELNINYIPQYKINSLYFDFAILSSNNDILYFIEYDGIQHFEKGHFHETAYDKTHKNDLIKNNYCFDNNIPLIRIPYNKKYTKWDLFLPTSNFILTKNNIENYYNN